MTCVVGLEVDGKVYIGGDSASASGWDIKATRLRKVFKLNGFLIGYTTSFRMGQLLEHQLDIDLQKDTQKDLEYMITTFIEAVRNCLKDGGFAKVENEQETGGQFLVGYRGIVYCIEQDFQVNTSIDGFDAVGCGAHYALGSLWATQDLSNPEERVLKALEVAGHFSNGVCPPYYIECLEAKSTAGELIDRHNELEDFEE